MANKNTVKSMNEYFNYMKSNTPNTSLSLPYGGGSSLNIEVKHYIPIEEKMLAIKEVSLLVFIQGIYHAELVDFAIGRTVLAHFTDLPIDDYGSEKDAKGYELLNEFMCNTHVVDAIADSSKGVKSFIAMARDMIDYKKSESLRTSVLNDIMNRCIDFLKSLDGKIDGLDLSNITNLTEGDSDK